MRFSNPDNLQAYLAGSPPQRIVVWWSSALQETCFLGLRLTRGLNLERVAAQFGNKARRELSPVITECIESGLMKQEGDFVRLTAKGRLLSNEVFEKFICLGEPAVV
jgi:oxygen-independent coproporphyrinogen-3 oxidase